MNKGHLLNSGHKPFLLFFKLLWLIKIVLIRKKSEKENEKDL